MDITQIKQSGFTWNIRVPKGYQDERMVFEVVASDQYHLEEMAAHFYPEVILDVGGHIGTFGVFAKTFWPEAKLIVVEPSIDNLVLYRLNAETNGLKDVTFINAAVGYDPECTCLVNSPTTTGGCVMRTHDAAKDYVLRQYRGYNKIRQMSVPLVTVEDLIGSYPRIDFAKWDCEGGEVDAFKGMTNQAAEKFRFMVGEYHIWGKDTDYLRPDLFDCIRFWRMVKRKFPHLSFNYKNRPLGNFQAWPKDL
jgi:FkbM family methyltransferase